MVSALGFGRPIDFEPWIMLPGAIAGEFQGQIRYIADGVGVEVDEVRETYDRRPTDQPIETAFGTVEPGTCGAIRFQAIGVVEGREAIVVDHVTRPARPPPLPRAPPHPAPPRPPPGLTRGPSGRRAEPEALLVGDRPEEPRPRRTDQKASALWGFTGTVVLAVSVKKRRGVMQVPFVLAEMWTQGELRRRAERAGRRPRRSTRWVRAWRPGA